MIYHDLYCKRCGREESDVRIVGGVFPECCGERMRWRPFHPKTDVYGRPVWSVAAGCYVTSSRERDKIMREAGFEPRGDKVHGGRNESHRNLGKSFSYSGQTVRKTLVPERVYKESDE